MDQIRALVVDDEEPLRGILKISLNYFGVEVIGEAENGEEAVEKYKELSPNVVIMDVNMPKMDGLEALDEIKKYDKDAVVIIITASDDENMKLEGIKAGCRGFLHKPLKMDELHQDILTNLRIYFAQQKGEKLEEDYYRYVVKPDFRPDSIREQQGLPSRPGISIPDPDAPGPSPVAKPAASEDAPPPAPSEPAPAAPEPAPAAPEPAPAAPEPAPAPPAKAETTPPAEAKPTAAPDRTAELEARIATLETENADLRHKLDHVSRSLKDLLAGLGS